LKIYFLFFYLYVNISVQNIIPRRNSRRIFKINLKFIIYEKMNIKIGEKYITLTFISNKAYTKLFFAPDENLQYTSHYRTYGTSIEKFTSNPIFYLFG